VFINHWMHSIMFLIAVIPLNHFVHTALSSRTAVLSSAVFLRNVTPRTVKVSRIGELR
jgi:hypothetical protein